MKIVYYPTSIVHGIVLMREVLGEYYDEIWEVVNGKVYDMNGTVKGMSKEVYKSVL